VHIIDEQTFQFPTRTCVLPSSVFLVLFSLLLVAFSPYDMLATMRAHLLTMLPLAAIANPLPDPVKSHIQKGADMRPYMIEQACKMPDKRYPDINRFDKAFKAVIAAQQMAQRTYEDW
jgi:hypothetical protein